MNKPTTLFAFALTLLLATPPLLANATSIPARCENHDVSDDEACEPSWWESCYENMEYVITHPLTITIAFGGVMWYLFRTKTGGHGQPTNPSSGNPDNNQGTPTTPKKETTADLEKNKPGSHDSERTSSEQAPSEQTLFKKTTDVLTPDVVNPTDGAKPKDNPESNQRSSSTTPNASPEYSAPSAPVYPVLEEGDTTPQTPEEVPAKRAFAKGITAALKGNRLFTKALAAHAKEDASAEELTKKSESSDLLAQAKRVGGAKGRRLPGKTAAKNQ